MAGFRSQTGFLNAQGAPLYYEVAGQGYPLLLIHAGVADSRMWDDQFEVFAQQYRVIRYDMRGFGRSPVPAGPFANHEDTAALLDFLGIKKAQLIVIPGAAHVVNMEQPEEFNRIVLDFLSLTHS